MELLEKDIEDIIYASPWLLDERFDIPNIRSKANRMPGRQVNVGNNGVNRYIDLLFRDTRDNRPVIIEIKKGDLVRENIAQILEYRALVISLNDEAKLEWLDEFGRNYYCPKLILIGTNASEEVRISANLAGIEIRTLVGEEKISVDFNEISEISQKLNKWNEFIKSGNRTLEDRDEWVREIYKMIKDVVREYDNDQITTIKKVYETSNKDSWIEGLTFPFISFPISYKEDYLCGIYEYFNESLCYSEEYVYFDFYIQRISNEEDEDFIQQLEAKVLELLKIKGYSIIVLENAIATIKIKRALLENVGQFKERLATLITDAIYLNDQIDIFELT
ncbi:hypothetical protein [Pelosinus sp. sgz500959]|uniref:hypothetical protein n=1 Tax=Pelosinus sp. sgz500959 TaxID=3242472 RepID=UPI0036715AA5